jgi:hypothetical protein
MFAKYVFLCWIVKLWDKKGEQDVGNYFQIIGFANANFVKIDGHCL